VYSLFKEQKAEPYLGGRFLLSKKNDPTFEAAFRYSIKLLEKNQTTQTSLKYIFEALRRIESLILFIFIITRLY